MLRQTERPTPIGAINIHDRLREKLKQKDSSSVSNDLFEGEIFNKFGVDIAPCTGEKAHIEIENNSCESLTSRVVPVKRIHMNQSTDAFCPIDAMKSDGISPTDQAQMISKLGPKQNNMNIGLDKNLNNYLLGSIGLLGALGCLFFSCRNKKSKGTSSKPTHTETLSIVIDPGAQSKSLKM